MSAVETNEPVRLGVIGCGVIGQQHLRGAAESELVDVVAVADISAELAASVAADHGISAAYRNPQELLDRGDIDAVVLALPTRPRQQLALDALAAGKHLLIEKPAAATAGDIEQLQAAQGTAVVACCSARFRTRPVAQTIAKVVASGQLGQIRELHSRGLRSAPPKPVTPPPAWRLSVEANGGGILWNWGSYDFDFLLGSVGWDFTPTVALGRTWPLAPEMVDWAAPGSDAESHGIGLVLGENGTALTIDRGEFLPIRRRSTTEIIGTAGSISIDYEAMDEGDLTVTIVDDSGAIDVLVEPQNDTHAAIPAALLNDFAGAIRNDRSPLTTLDHAALIARITDAICQSSDSQQAVYF